MPIRNTGYAALAAIILGLTGNAAWAGGSFAIDGRNACTGTNCGTLAISGYYTASNGVFAGGTWVYQVYAEAGDCLRLHVTTANRDLEMAVVSPDPALGSSVGNIWADDDSGGSLRPLIKIDPVPRTGRYTVVLSRFSSANGNTPFTLRYGRYNSGNLNCFPPSTPGSQAGAIEAKLDQH